MSNPYTSLSLIALTLLSVTACGIAKHRLRRPQESPTADRMQKWLVALVCIAAGLLFAYRWLAQHGQWQPLVAHVDGLLLIAVLFAAAILFMQSRPKLHGLTAFAMPLLTLILAWSICASAWTYHPFHLETLHPVWKGVHLSGVYLGTLCSALAAIAGGMYLYVQSRLKRKIPLGGTGRMASLEALESLIVRAATLGFVLLTLGLASGLVIVSGKAGLLQIGSWYWSKIILAGAAWSTFAVVMNVRYASSFRGARAAWLSIGGLVLLLTIYGVVSALPVQQGDGNPPRLIGLGPYPTQVN